MIQKMTKLLALIPPELRLEIEGGKVVEAGAARGATMRTETRHAFKPPLSLERGAAWVGAHFRSYRSVYLRLEDGAVLLWRKAAKTSRNDLWTILSLWRDVRKLHVITMARRPPVNKKSAGSEWPWREVGK